MFTHFWIKIILFELLLKFISLEILAEKNDTDTDIPDQEPPITVSHNIIDQESVYGNKPNISKCFIDLIIEYIQYQFYYQKLIIIYYILYYIIFKGKKF